MKYWFSLATLLIPPLEAKDFRVQGSVYPVVERSPVEVIEEQLQDLDPSELEGLLKQATDEEKLFAPIKGWRSTEIPQRFRYDPTYTAPQDIKDHKGSVLFKKGEKVNPLAYHPMEKTLLFIDGRDEIQIQWALKKYPQSSKIILVAGSPLIHMKTYKKPFTFDQSSHLLNTFGITQIPAVVSISGGEIWIEELKLEDDHDA